MKSPLNKRIPREIFGEFAKYIAIFLFMTLTIGFISGFLVAGSSMKTAYDESFEKYNIEDGHFILNDKADDELLKEIEKDNVKLYELFYNEQPADADNDGENDSTIRLFKNRTEINKVCVMEGELPQENSEIAIDRMYAENNNLDVGDIINVNGIELKISGFVALSDYSALFSDNSDMMFDSVKFCVAIVNDYVFDAYGENHLYYCYAWKYDNAPDGEKQEKEMSDDFMKSLDQKAALSSYIPRYQNQAINFTGDDIDGDSSLMIVLLYVLIVIMAFVFSVSINHTINKEANVIGTLRASGYTRREMLEHYLAAPMIVTLLAAVIGNVLGYTIFKEVAAGMYYGSYSLPTYVTIWNAKAFLLTTVVPMIIMLIINVISLRKKLALSPLRFIRCDISRHKNSKAVRLPKFKFFSRFRIRIIMQNIPNYAVLFIGMIFAGIILLFGMMMTPLLKHHQDSIVSNMIAQYQYVLKAPVAASGQGAEKYSAASYRYATEEVTVYGIIPDSAYVKEELPEDGVIISDSMADKYRLEQGDEITIKEEYADDEYTLTVRGIMTYPAAMAVFMDYENFNNLFGKDEGYFTGYFSDEELTDIDDNYIAACVTEEDLTKVSRQLDVSMGKMFYMVYLFALLMAALLIYLLTKLVLEKNANSISMVKILGYENREIARLYLIATTWVVIIATALSMLVATLVIKLLYFEMLKSMSGWMILWIDPNLYWKMFLMIIGIYIVVAALQFIKIKKIPMDQALKNVE